jgi:transcription-repair coupling factor (superfamily II helicase)
LGGVEPEGRAFLIAALAEATGRTVMISCARPRDRERLADELDVWLGPGAAEVFPEEERIGPDALPDEEARSQRLRVVSRLAERGALRAVVTSERAVGQPVPGPGALRAGLLHVARGGALAPEELAARLVAAGFLAVPRVDGRGQFAVRGGIVDVFPAEADLPLRVEFFGDTVESVREFSTEDQLRRRELNAVSMWLRPADLDEATLRDHLPGDVLEVDVEAVPSGEDGGPVVPAISGHGFPREGLGDEVLLEARRERLLRSLEEWAAAGWETVLACNNEGEAVRLREVLGPAGGAGVRFVIAPLRRGFTLPSARLALVTDAEIFSREDAVVVSRRERRLAEARARRGGEDAQEWREGDAVVHLHHGVALFLGIHPVNLGGERDEEALVLEYAEGARLYVPLDQAHLVSRYAGLGRKRPELDTLGGARWERKRIQAGKAVMDYAAQLLRLEAERQVRPGHAVAPDGDWQREFEAAFVHEETADQIAAIEATKRDMEAARPMDRLICGDVGFGKTEVAIRAAFKSVAGGRQVAFLCPTTVLAQQHFRTLRQRFADYPIRVAMLSRFVPPREQQNVVAGLASGEVDVVVGTHRLVSPDVKFHRLGLLVVDEEQRFGVRHKDRMKERFRQIDILTLSATPIPRTLYLALTGARDMSTIETPPRGRVSIHTQVLAYDERVIRAAIERERARGGQVFFLHNRIGTIERVAARLTELVPGLRVLVGHGQMDEEDLEHVMMEFVAGRADVLVSTSIIESGIDIPNANTIIIDRADRFGLADLYQLRGRVGRGEHQAHAFLFLPREAVLSGVARRRTGAIEQYAELGAGFKIAMRDLEMRGAGNLLGTKQSGHITAIGFDLYCKLLRQAVESMRTGRPVSRREVSVRLDFLARQEGEAGPGRAGAYLPSSFLRDARQRMAAYRELHECDTPADVDGVRGRWTDRFGRLPAEVDRLLRLTRVQRRAAERMVQALEVVEGQVRIKIGGDYLLVGTRMPRLRSEEPAACFDEWERMVLSLLER